MSAPGNGALDGFNASDRYFGYQWASLDQPDFAQVVLAPTTIDTPLIPAVGNPCATLYLFASAGNTSIWAFGGHLVAYQGCDDLLFGGYDSYWADEGLPPQLAGTGNGLFGPSAVSYDDEIDGERRIHVFAVGYPTSLFRKFWKGNLPIVDWSAHGQPTNTGVWGPPRAITYNEGGRRIYVFSRAQNSHLVVNYCIGTVCDSFDGNSWSWADQGTR